MRAHEFIAEMPMTVYKPLGDFNKSGPFTGVDKKLVVHPKSELKAAKFFQKTPYDFRLFFSNISGTGKVREYGPMSPKVVKEVFGKSAEEILKGSENAITVVFVGNAGEAKVMLTPWMMAHRFGHAISAEGRYSINDQNTQWNELAKHFFSQVNDILTDYYDWPTGKARGKSSFFVDTDRYKEYSALFNAIGTQRSSRTGKINRPYEFIYEMLAQYLATGHVTLNPLPLRLALMRHNSLSLTDPSSATQVTSTLSRDMEILFSGVLSECEGKIFVI